MSLTNSSPSEVAKAASISALTLARLPVTDRNHALQKIHDALRDSKSEILQANARDLELAAKAAQNGELSQSLVKRLDLGRKGKFEDMLQGILDVEGLEDPGMLVLFFAVNVVLKKQCCYTSVYLSSCHVAHTYTIYLSSWQNRSPHRTRRGTHPGTSKLPYRRAPHHLRSPPRSHRQHRLSRYQIWQCRHIKRYALFIAFSPLYLPKAPFTHHTHPFPGGKESTLSFTAIATTISRALSTTTVPNDSIQLVTTRDVIDPLLQQDRYINLVIPRGSNDLVSYIKNHTRIPVLGHADGLCSAYLCADADLEGAKHVILDAKLGYPAACNAIETLLVDEAALGTLLPPIASALLAQGVSLRCDALAKQALARTLEKHEVVLLQDAVDADYDTEFLDLILAVKTIPSPSPSSTSTSTSPDTNRNTDPSLDLAIAHINAHSSHHTDIILTSSPTRAESFMSAIDSAGVFWNASSRFADGTRFGFGTEVGISTNKIHARGPVGLEGLCVYKYKLRGKGQGAGDYGGGESGGRRYVHKALPL